MSIFWKIDTYDWRSNKYRSILSCVIGTLNFLARRKRNMKQESEREWIHCRFQEDYRKILNFLAWFHIVKNKSFLRTIEKRIQNESCGLARGWKYIICMVLVKSSASFKTKSNFLNVRYQNSTLTHSNRSNSWIGLNPFTNGVDGKASSGIRFTKFRLDHFP